MDKTNGSPERIIVYADGSKGTHGDYPVALSHIQTINAPDRELEVNNVVDPVFDDNVTRNLYGRIMTLVEATTDPLRLKAVKDVFSKELLAWENDVYASARQIAITGSDILPNNIYLK